MRDIVATTITGLIGAGVAILFVPEMLAGVAFAVGGVGGLLTGLINQPLRWILRYTRRTGSASADVRPNPNPDVTSGEHYDR